MKAPERAVLLVGSPKTVRSTSAALGAYLLERLAPNGIATREVRLHRSLATKEGCQAMLDLVEWADLVVLSSPLYVDTLPAPVIRAMELIAGRLGGREPRLFCAMLNCGFPESSQNETALAVCRRFAQEVGWRWMGGLAMGMGPIIAGQPLTEAGYKVRHVRAALEGAAAALAGGHPVPKDAIEMMARPIVPATVYVRAGDAAWKRTASAHGAEGKLEDRPYAP